MMVARTALKIDGRSVAFNVKPWPWKEPDSFPPEFNIDPSGKAQCVAIARLYIHAPVVVPESARMYGVPP